MKSRWSAPYNVFIFIFALVVLCGIQSTLWLQFFGKITPPLLWLNLFVFIMLYKRPTEGVFLVYLLGFGLTAFTIAPLKIIWITLLVLFGIVFFIKTRIFWPGAGYFTIMCSLIGILYHVVYLITSRSIEPNPASVEFGSRFLQMILTPLFAPVTYWVLTKLTQNSSEELTHNTGGLDS